MVTADKFTLLREDCAIDLGGKKLKILSFKTRKKKIVKNWETSSIAINHSRSMYLKLSNFEIT